MKPFFCLCVLLLSPVALAADFTPGPVIKNYGGVAEVKQSKPLSGKATFGSVRCGGAGGAGKSKPTL